MANNNDGDDRLTNNDLDATDRRGEFRSLMQELAYRVDDHYWLVRWEDRLIALMQNRG